MYDSTAVGFLLCMLMILYNFNNATVARRRWGGGSGGSGGGGGGILKPANPPLASQGESQQITCNLPKLIRAREIWIIECRVKVAVTFDGIDHYVLDY